MSKGIFGIFIFGEAFDSKGRTCAETSLELRMFLEKDRITKSRFSSTALPKIGRGINLNPSRGRKQKRKKSI